MYYPKWGSTCSLLKANREASFVERQDLPHPPPLVGWRHLHGETAESVLTVILKSVMTVL